MRKYETHAPPQVPISCHFQPYPPSIRKARVNQNGERCNDGPCLDVVKIEFSKGLQSGGTYSRPGEFEHPVPCPPYQTRRNEATRRNLHDSGVTEIEPNIQRKSQQIVHPEKAYVSEKYAHDNYPVRSSINWHTVPSPSRLTFSGSNKGHIEDNMLERRLTWTLLYLSLLSPFLSLLISFYTFLIVVFVLVLVPCHCFTARKPLHQQAIDLLLPPLRLQFQLIYSSYEPVSQARVHMLLFVGLASPVYSIFIALASWISACFWIYTAVLGNPEGSSQEDHDGRAAVLKVRQWWQQWLERGTSPQIV